MSYSRRQVLRLASGSVGALAGCAAPTRPRRGTEEGNEEWPSFRKDLANTGCVPNAAGPTEEPSETWTARTGAPIWGSPAVVDGTVYVGSTDRHLYAIDAASGKTKWRFRTEGPIQSTPAVDDGTVYVGSLDKRLYAVDAETGEKQWEYETPGFILSSPKVDGETVYIGSGAILAPGILTYRESEQATQRGGGLYAVEKTTGESRWSALTESKVIGTPAIDGDAVYVGDVETSRIYSFATADGSTRWWYGGPQDFILSSPTVKGGTVYLPGYDQTVWAIDSETANVDWTFETDGLFIYASPAVCNDTLYVPVSGTPSPEPPHARVYALSLEGGSERWMHELDDPLTGSSPAVTDDAIYLGTHTQVFQGDPPEGPLGALYGLSLEGDRYWRYEMAEGEGIGTSPALVDGTLYFGADDTRVYALE